MATNGVNRITDKILADAQARADKILADAQAECDKISADYNARAQQIRDKLSDDAQAKGTDLIARANDKSHPQSIGFYTLAPNNSANRLLGTDSQQKGHHDHFLSTFSLFA